MSKRRNSPKSSRRNFLKGAGLAGAAAALTPPVAANALPAAQLERAKAAVPGPRQIAAETMPPNKDPVTQTSSGGDFMVDVFKQLDIEYLTMNCASSFRGLQEAVINYGGNKKPEIINCPHEDIAVHMAQGYAKIEGKPIAMIGHGVVGIQHATMAMYNAWCDRVPMIVMGGNIMEANKRAPGAEWVHSAVDINQIVREFTKWDDQPASLQHFAEFDGARLQDRGDAADGAGDDRARCRAAGKPDPGSRRAAHSEARHRDPAAGRRRRARGSRQDARGGGKSGDHLRSHGAHARRHEPPRRACRDAAMRRRRQCRPHELPSRHPLNQSFRRGVIGQADVILAIEMNDLWGALNTFNDRINRSSRSNVKKGAKLITLGVRDLYLKGNYQDFGRYEDTDLNIAGDGEASLPALTEAVKRLVDEGRKAAFEARGKKFAASHLAMVNQSKIDATIGWDSSPITTARMAAEVYAQIKDEDWSLVGNAIRNTWPHRLWDIKKSYQWNGGSGGAGVGYNLPASLGAALANKKHGRFTVAFGGDGDFMFNPGTLWTAAHHQIPMLYIIHNNRAYHQEYMYLAVMAARHGRGVDKVDIGTTIKDPNVDYATVARGMGAYGEGPIIDPKDLAPALKRAIAAVKAGQPAVVDVVTDPR